MIVAWSVPFRVYDKYGQPGVYSISLLEYVRRTFIPEFDKGSQRSLHDDPT